jgi:hypothetical protein
MWSHVHNEFSTHVNYELKIQFGKTKYARADESLNLFEDATLWEQQIAENAGSH